MWTNHLSAPWTFTTLLLWKVFPLPLFSLTVSIHLLSSHFSIQGKNMKCIFCIGIPDLFLKWTMKLFTKGVCTVYNNLLWMWITLFCQKAFSLQNCSVHTWQAGKELLFHYNVPYNLENIEPLKSVPVMRSSSLRSWLSRVSNRLSISHWHELKPCYSSWVLPNIYYFTSWHSVIWRNFLFLMSALFPLLWA